MVLYFSKGFFDEVANRLNGDPDWTRRSASVTTRILLTCSDRNASFLLDIRGGAVRSSEVAPDVHADFKFEGNYDAWTQLGRGEQDLQGLVFGGEIRFRGSLPKIMALLGHLNRITQVAQEVPKEF